MATMIGISIAHRNELIALARASPVEVCGLLLGSAGQIADIVPCANVADDPATRFELDPRALIAAHRAARGGGPQVIGHYHSHPSGRAEPSMRDAADAAPDGSIWIIVAGDEVTAWRAVAAGAMHGRFAAVTLATLGCEGGGQSPQGGHPATSSR